MWLTWKSKTLRNPHWHRGSNYCDLSTIERVFVILKMELELIISSMFIL